MPDHSKVFTYETDGLSYTVTVYEDPDTGAFFADIAVLEGAMDVNAIYIGDNDASGESESLAGPLNMNGAKIDGENIQWDEAFKLSDPGLGPEGADKETYLGEGDTLTVELDIESLDEIDILGIRATSTSTDEGSIKAVSDDPEEPEEPEDPEEPVFDKVGFGIEFGETGLISNGVYILEDALPEGEDGTFENYVNLYESQYGDDPEYNLTEVQSVIFYELVDGTDENGNPVEIPQELFRLDAPEGGFEDADHLLAAFDEAIENGALDGASTGEDGELELMAALMVEEDTGEDTETGSEDNALPEEELEFG